jgi:hypothetical protein
MCVQCQSPRTRLLDRRASRGETGDESGNHVSGSGRRQADIPASCRYSEPSVAPKNVIAPLSATTAFHRRATSSTAASGLSSIRDLSLPLKCASSPAWGVSNIGDEDGAAEDAGACLDDTSRQRADHIHRARIQHHLGTPQALENRGDKSTVPRVAFHAGFDQHCAGIIRKRACAGAQVSALVKALMAPLVAE